MARQKLDRERTEQIMVALERCIADKGLAHTSLADVARAADLPRPLVRYFVGNRDDMIGKLFERIIARGERELETLTGGGDPPPLAARLELLGSRLFTNTLTNRIASELWCLADRDEKIRARLAALYQRIIEDIAEGVALDHPGLSGPKRTTIAQAIVAYYYGDASFTEGLGFAGPTSAQKGKLANAMVQAML